MSAVIGHQKREWEVLKQSSLFDRAIATVFSHLLKSPNERTMSPLVYGKLQNTRGWGHGLLLSHNHVKRTVYHACMYVANRLGKSNQCYLTVFLNDLQFASFKIYCTLSFCCLTGRNNAHVCLGSGLSI